MPILRAVRRRSVDWCGTRCTPALWIRPTEWLHIYTKVLTTTGLSGLYFLSQAVKEMLHHWLIEKLAVKKEMSSSNIKVLREECARRSCYTCFWISLRGVWDTARVCVCVLWLFAFVHAFSCSVNQPWAFTICELMYGWLSREAGAQCLKAQSVIRGEQKKVIPPPKLQIQRVSSTVKKSDESVNIFWWCWLEALENMLFTIQYWYSIFPIILHIHFRFIMARNWWIEPTLRLPYHHLLYYFLPL